MVATSIEILAHFLWSRGGWIELHSQIACMCLNPLYFHSSVLHGLLVKRLLLISLLLLIRVEFHLEVKWTTFLSHIFPRSWLDIFPVYAVHGWSLKYIQQRFGHHRFISVARDVCVPLSDVLSFICLPTAQYWCLFAYPNLFFHFLSKKLLFNGSLTNFPASSKRHRTVL